MMNMWGMFKATISDSFNDHLRSLVSRLKKKGDTKTNKNTCRNL